MVGLGLAEQVILMLVKHKQRWRIQTSQTGGQLYNDTSAYNVSDCSLHKPCPVNDVISEVD